MDASKEVCATCDNWKGSRERRGSEIVPKGSARALCENLKKLTPPHGGCNYWSKWEPHGALGSDSA